jgi:hypothetical protein
MLHPEERRHYPRANIKLPVIVVAGESLVEGYSLMQQPILLTTQLSPLPT